MRVSAAHAHHVGHTGGSWGQHVHEPVAGARGAARFVIGVGMWVGLIASCLASVLALYLASLPVWIAYMWSRYGDSPNGIADPTFRLLGLGLAVFAALFLFALAVLGGLGEVRLRLASRPWWARSATAVALLGGLLIALTLRGAARPVPQTPLLSVAAGLILLLGQRLGMRLAARRSVPNKRIERTP